MPKLSFKIPEHILQPAPKQEAHHDKDVLSIGMLGSVGVIAIVALVMVFSQALVGGPSAYAVSNLCGQGVVADHPAYADQLESVGYRCSNAASGLWCCHRR